MTYQVPPKISRRAIDRAGDVLIDDSSTVKSLERARDILNQWRACHAYPINTFNSTLRFKIRSAKFGKNPIIAQRLKRASTIITKLKEGKNSDIKLLNMQDIAGVRAILPTIDDVVRLKDAYQKSKYIKHKLHPRSKDYIFEPKEKDGYRSVHLIYRYKNLKQLAWNGLWVELQIRTRLQHSWATAVETMHTFLGKAIKTRQGQNSDEKWTSYFRFISSAFALMEKTPLPSCHKNLKPEDIRDAIRKNEKELHALEKLRAFPVAMESIMKGRSGSHFHLIILDMSDPTKKIVTVRSYGRDDFGRANQDYSDIEKQSIGQEAIEPVLVSSTNFQEAYSSFFADTQFFQENLKKILSGNFL